MPPDTVPQRQGVVFSTMLEMSLGAQAGSAAGSVTRQAAAAHSQPGASPSLHFRNRKMVVVSGNLHQLLYFQ